MSIDHDPVESAWKIHAAIVDWTGKVDTKASFVLAAESAASLVAITLSGGGRRLSDISNLGVLIAYYLGVCLLGGAIVLVVLVVRPRLRADHVSVESARNFIFFGHARDWEADSLADALITRDILPQITRQVVAISKIAWTKHICLKWSINLAIGATAMLIVVALFNDSRFK